MIQGQFYWSAVSEQWNVSASKYIQAWAFSKSFDYALCAIIQCNKFVQ